MNNRYRNLTILIALMMIPVICLCACMAQDKPEETESIIPPTTNPGYGIADVEDDTEPWAETPVTTQPQDSEETTLPTTATNPTQSVADEEKPTVDYKPGSVGYEEFLKLSHDEQQAYASSFPSISDYIAWFNAEKAKHDNSEVIEITGPIDLGELTGKNMD